MDFFIFTFVHKIAFGETPPTHWFKYFSLLFQVSDTLVVSGCEGGKVKVWDIEQACLLKVRTFLKKHSPVRRPSLIWGFMRVDPLLFLLLSACHAGTQVNGTRSHATAQGNGCPQLARGTIFR